MKKIMYLLPLLMMACTKEVIVYRYINTDNTLLITKDTILNGSVWDGNGKVLRTFNNAIIYNGVLRNWVIDAPFTSQIFDTSIVLQNCVPYGDRFSTAWYGASPNKADNWPYFMKSINTCMANSIWYCYTPAGDGKAYNYSKPIDINNIYKGNYSFCSLRFGGDASFWDISRGTTLHYTGLAGSALNLQLNKGSKIDNIIFRGEFKSPSGSDNAYFSNTEETFQDISGHHIGDWLYGITIDGNKPLDSKTFGGSTGITLENVTIDGFTKLLAMSPNGITANDDILRVHNLHLVNGKYGIQSGQAQEKDMRFDGVYCWGSLYCLISIGHAGKYQAGNYSFSNGSIAGRVIRLCDISASGWYSTHIDNFFCESIREIGVISTKVPITISNSDINLNPLINTDRIILWGNSPLINISSCIIGYNNGNHTDVWVHGQMTFQNCWYRGGQLIFK